MPTTVRTAGIRTNVGPDACCAKRQVRSLVIYEAASRLRDFPRMVRALTLGLSISLAVVAGAAIVHWSMQGDAPPPPGPNVAEEPKDHPPPPVFDAPSAPSAQEAATRVWVETAVTQRLRAASEAFVITRMAKAIRADAAVIAGAGGPFVPPSARKSAALVRIRHDGGEWHRRAPRRDDGALCIDLGPERAIRGRVVDQQAKPVANAVVWFGGAADQLVRTDADGAFEAMAAAGPGVPVVVRAEGKAWKHAFVQVDAASGADVTFALLEEMPVLVQAAGTLDALHHAEVAVVPLSVMSTELQTYPFFAQGLWSDTVLDQDGRGVLRGLPRGCEVGVLLIGPAVCRTAPVEIALRGDGPVHARLSAPDLPRVRVALVDERGNALQGCEVRCVPPERAPTDASSGPFLLPEWLPPRGGSVFVRGEGERLLACMSARDPVRIVASDGVLVAETEPFVVGAESVRVVLPQRPLGRPSLVVPPPVSGGPWTVRVDPFTRGEFVDAKQGEPFVVELDGSSVVDVSVRVPDGAAWTSPRTQRGIVVTAPTGLSPTLVSER